MSERDERRSRRDSGADDSGRLSHARKEAKSAVVHFIFAKRKTGAVQDNWEHLRYFLALARHGSLAGAARHLEKAETTVWRHLAALEDDLGCRLFERKRGGYLLSEAGQHLLKQAERVEAEILNARQALAGDAPAVAGQLRLTAPAFLAVWFTEAFLPSLQRRHPLLCLEIVTGSPTAILARRETDLALRFNAVREGDFATEAETEIGFGLYASRVYGRRHGRAPAPDRFDGHRLIAFDESVGHVAPQRWLSRGGRGAEVVLRSNSAALRLAAAKRHLGATLLPSIVGDRDRALECWFPAERLGRLPLSLLVARRIAHLPRGRVARDALALLLDDNRAALRG